MATRAEGIVRSQEEIDDVLNKASEAMESGTTAYRGETFETGVEAMYQWLVGHLDEPPL